MSKKQKIFFEGLGLVESHFSGIGQYILGILKGIDAELEQKKLAGLEVPEVRVIIPYDTVDKFNRYGFKNISPKVIPLKFRIVAGLWHRGKMIPLDLLCGRAHYVFTRFVSMPLLFSKYSAVIYDLSFELYREFSDEKNAEFLSKGTKKTVGQATNIFTISNNAKKEIHNFYNVPNDKIIVATPATDQSVFYRRSQNEIEKIKFKYGIKNNYILALSNLEPRKNLETLVDAYVNLPKSYRNNISLLLVGVSGWKTDALFTKIKNLYAQGYDIIRPEKYVTDEDKPAIISGAKMLVYPSHYEGFGMPPLEALACGTPVITSDNSSLPEVVEGAGIMLNCSDTQSFTNEIRHILDNWNEIHDEMLTKGPERASIFSWEESARMYLEGLSK